jgi:hypothetical protein
MAGRCDCFPVCVCGEGLIMTNGKISNDGMTQKELIIMVLEGQEKINERIDEVHEKVNTKMGRQEFSGWLVAVSALVVLVNNVM